MQIIIDFKDDSVEIIKIDDSDSEVIDNFKEGIKELDLINIGKIKPKEVEDFLNEL